MDELVRCRLTRFGCLNNEGLSEHELYAQGLTHYAVPEVRNSQWKQQEADRAGAPHTLPNFLIAFHDTTFECLAEELRFEICRDGCREAASDAFSRVLGSSL